MNAILPRTMPKLQITRTPDAGNGVFLARLRLRMHELADDLRLPDAPEIVVHDAPPRSPPRLRLGDRRLGIPQSLSRQKGPEEPEAIDLAERVAAALQSARWQLIAPHLRLPTKHLRAACALGLNLDDLRALASQAHDATECAWAACELAPARFQVLLPPQTIEDGLALQRLAEDGAERFGLVVPPASLAVDDGLGPSQLRLRLRRRRLPVQTFPGDGSAPLLRETILRSLRESAAELIDAEAVAALLVDPDDAPLVALVALSANDGGGIAEIAQALRQVYSDGIVATHPALLRRTLLSHACDAVDTGPDRWPVALPGAQWTSSRQMRSAEWAARLRAALVGPAIRQGAAEGFRAVWTLTRHAAEAAERARDDDLDRLAAAALPCARAGGILLTTTGDARAVRSALADDLPTLLVCDESEWPRDLQPTLRGTIDLPDTTATRGES